eukprot:scaffold110734_cov75-Phaeocystis_antarctica.AAC.3
MRLAQAEGNLRCTEACASGRRSAKTDPCVHSTRRSGVPLDSRPKGLRQSRLPACSGLGAQSSERLWTCCATVGAGSQFRSDDLDDADWAAVRPTEQPAQPELGRCYFDVEARRTAHTEQQHEARQPHLRARACAWADPSVILLHSATALGRHGIRRLARSHYGKRLLHGTHNLLLYGEGGISNNNSRRTTTTRLHVSTHTAHKNCP